MSPASGPRREERLIEEGRRTKKGGKWASESVQKVLANEDLYERVLQPKK